jgi:two-component system NarL family sensor kinase
MAGTPSSIGPQSATDPQSAIGPQSAVGLERHARELQIVNEIAQALNRTVDLHAALHTTLARVAALLHLHAGWVWLFNEQTGQPFLAAAQNLPPALADTPSRMEGWCWCLESFRDGDMADAANINVITCSRLKNLVDGTDGLRYHASIPLLAHGRKLGVLNVASVDWCGLSADDLRLLYTVGDMLGIAIERARLFQASAELGAATERNRLAREMHDTLAQGLSAITLQLETADALLDGTGDPPRVQAIVREAIVLARRTLDEARRSVLDLRAAPLEGRTLAAAVEEAARAAAARTGSRARFRFVGEHQPLPAAVEAGLYRVAQEALANVERHAGARTLWVKLLATPQRVELVVKDDGRGFDPDQVSQGRYGLLGMQERVRLLGGELSLASAPGQGTQVYARVPLEPEA